MITKRRLLIAAGIILLAFYIAASAASITMIVHLRPALVDSRPGWTNFYQEHLTLWQYRFLIGTTILFGLPAALSFTRARGSK